MGNYQPPAFYFFHGARLADPVDVVPNEASQSPVLFSDSRLSDAYEWTTDLDSSNRRIEFGVGARSVEVDTLIISGHNFFGADITCVDYDGPGTENILFARREVTEPDGTTIIQAFSEVPVADILVLKVIPFTGGGSIIPRISQVFLTTKREMTRGPRPDFDTSSRRTQQTLTSPAGVTTTISGGPARKTYTLTWENVSGLDGQILRDLRTETADWSFPFWFSPPDSDYPLVFVELENDVQEVQGFDGSGDSGTSSNFTLKMIEALG